MSGKTGTDAPKESFDTSRTKDETHVIPCDACRDKWFRGVTQLADHLKVEHGMEFSEYLAKKPLHRCPYCERQLSDLEQYVCEECSEAGIHPDQHEGKVPCQYCGEEWTNPKDPFCSPVCASIRIDYGQPLTAPTSVDKSWLNGPFRHENGILSCSPHLHQHEFVCRHCYLYSSNNSRKLGVHVSKKHSIEWEEYIELYKMNRCRVCETPLNTLNSYYCGPDCQFNDATPKNRCKLPGCEKPVDKGNVYCSRSCGYKGKDKR